MFEHHVASFDPTAEGVLLWTRARTDHDISWTVATDLDLRDVVAHGEVRAIDDCGTVVVDVGGLRPATTYYFAFTAAGERSPIGRTRTLPAGHVDRFRIAVACCSRMTDAPLGVYRAIADHDVDLVLHLGDYIYETDAPRGHEGEPETAYTLEQYERRYATVRADPDCIALHLRHPVVAVWDDGDLCDLAATDGAPGHDPGVHGAWSERVHAALSARARWLPSRRLDPEHPSTSWGSLVIGDLAELLLLDTRLAGRDRQAGEPGAKPLHDPNRSLLGAAQRAWLHDRIEASRATWAVPVSGVVVNEIVLPLPVPDGTNERLPSGYAYLDGKVMHDDQWDGYPAERDALARRLRARHGRARSTLLLSGDVHGSWAFEGPPDPDTGDATSVEFTVPAVSSPTMEQSIAPGARGLGRVVRRAVQQLPHVRYADLTHHGYGVLELTPARATMTWWHLDPYAENPAQDRRVASRLQVEVDAWPPTLIDAPEPGSGADAPSSDAGGPPPNPVPRRPPDVAPLRRARDRARRRRAATWVAIGMTAVSAATAAARAFRSRSPA